MTRTRIQIALDEAGNPTTCSVGWYGDDQRKTGEYVFTAEPFDTPEDVLKFMLAFKTPGK